jgi:hypothetical protein
MVSDCALFNPQYTQRHLPGQSLNLTNEVRANAPCDKMGVRRTAPLTEKKNKKVALRPVGLGIVVWFGGSGWAKDLERGVRCNNGCHTPERLSTQPTTQKHNGSSSHKPCQKHIEKNHLRFLVSGPPIGCLPARTVHHLSSPVLPTFHNQIQRCPPVSGQP